MKDISWSTLKVIRFFLGLTLIISISFFVYRYGTVINQIQLSSITAAILVSCAIIFFNSMVLRSSVLLYKGTLTLKNAVFLASMTTFTNALSGMPLGTAIKFAALHNKSGLKKREILAGQIYFTFLNAFLLLTVGVSVVIPEASILLIFLFIVLYFLMKKIGFSQVIPLLEVKVMFKSLSLSLSVTTLMIFCYFMIVDINTARVDMYSFISMICMGLVLGFSSGAPSLGGLQEILMGVASQLVIGEALFGVELALIMRFVSLVSSIPFLCFSLIRKEELNSV